MDIEKRKRTAILISITFATFINPFMISALGVALPSIGNDFQVSPGELGLVETSYLMAAIILLLPIGKYADKVGLGRIYISGMAMFLITSLIIGISPSFNFLVGLRFIQGLSIAMLTATGAAILTKAYPTEQRGRVLGINIGSVYVGLSMGPFLGGLITELYGWKSIFLIVAALSLIALVLISRTLDFKKNKTNSRYNIKSAIQYALLISMIWFGFSYLHKNLFFIVLIIAGIIGFAYFLVHQDRSPNPILDVRLFKTNKAFTMGNSLTFINYASSVAVTFTFSLFLQYVRGLSPKEAGMVLIIQPVVMMVFAPISGRISDRFNPNILVFMGILSCTIGLLFVLTIGTDSPMYLIYILLVFFGLGFALFSSANMNQVMSSVTTKYYGVASSMVGTMRTVGMLTSISIASGIFTLFIGNQQMAPGLEDLFLQGIRLSFIIFILISALGLYISYKMLKLPATTL
ncbi:MFS transporter [Bacteroidota bacterium]